MPSQFSETELVNAHSHCSHNLDEVQKSSNCACFSCLKTFSPSEITEWLEDGTVVCPYCLVDSILGSMSGYPLTQDFLAEMNNRWFRITRKPQRKKNTRNAILEIIVVTSVGLALENLLPNNLWVLALVIAGFASVTLIAISKEKKIKRKPYTLQKLRH